jgi:LacI family transcriptional regulator
MTCDDERGQHITEACKQAGIQIPDEIAVLGVDNDEMTCNLSDPPLSSIALNTEKGGYESAKLMNEMITGKMDLQYDIYVMPTQIVERQSTDIASTSDRYIAKALKFIHQNIEKRITVGDVIKQVPLSRRALEMRFQETTGTGVYKYIYNLQIDKFAQKLLDSDKTIFEIAIDSGFDNSKNISRQFKQVKGCTPAEYRRRNLSKG